MNAVFPTHPSLWAMLAGLFFLFSPSNPLAASSCVEVRGESAVVENDAGGARIEAVNRAKLAAVEQVAGVAVESRTMVESGALLDDLITTQMQGVITGYRILSEQRDKDTLTVTINACVETARARKAVATLARNAAVTVLLTARRPGTRHNTHGEEENLLSTTVIGQLSDNGYIVRDLADTDSMKLQEIESALGGGDSPRLRNLLYRHLANTLLLGTVVTTRSTAKGEDAGHGIRMPFDHVAARLTYRLMTRDSGGKIKVLAAGSQEAKGLGPTTDDAYAAALRNLAETFAPLILEKLQARLQEISAKVTVTLEGTVTPEETISLRESFQYLPWVSGVEASGPGRFQITYPENQLYLANSLTQKGFKITGYTTGSIRIRR